MLLQIPYANGQKIMKTFTVVGIIAILATTVASLKVYPAPRDAALMAEFEARECCVVS